MEMFLAAVAFYTSFPVSEFYVTDESSGYSSSITGHIKQSPREGLIRPNAAINTGSATSGRTLQIQQSITDGSAILRRDAKQSTYSEHTSGLQSHLGHLGTGSVLSPFADSGGAVNKSSGSSLLAAPNSRSNAVGRFTVASIVDDRNSGESEDQFSEDDSLFPTVSRKLDLKKTKPGAQNSGFIFIISFDFFL